MSLFLVIFRFSCMLNVSSSRVFCLPVRALLHYLSSLLAYSRSAAISGWRSCLVCCSIRLSACTGLGQQWHLAIRLLGTVGLAELPCTAKAAAGAAGWAAWSAPPAGRGEARWGPLLRLTGLTAM